MNLIDWKENYSVNIKEIDEQHKKLIDLINRLYDAMRSGHGKDELGGILKELIEYTKYHFQTEEKILTKYSYPKYNEHKKEHEELTKRVEEISNKLSNGQLILTSNVLTFLKNWLNDHILIEDKNYSAFLTSKGLK